MLVAAGQNGVSMENVLSLVDQVSELGQETARGIHLTALVNLLRR